MRQLSQCTWPRTQRIRNRADFVLCYEANHRYFSRYFVLFVRRREELGWRVGFTVSKKMGNAVRRNSIKRVLREFFRLHKRDVPQQLDIVVVPKRNLIHVPVSYALVHAQLSPLLEKLRGLGERVT